jgi:hypothetical protein
MNKLLLLPMLLLAACTPAQGLKPLVYPASSADVLAVVAELCPTLTPNSSYRPFTVVSTTATGLICYSKSVFPPSNFNVYDPVTLRINVTQTGSATSVSGTEDWGGTLITNQNALNAVFAALDQRFGRVR